MILRFAIASTVPAICTLLACFFGGVWPLLAVLSITVVAFFLDKLTGEDWSAPLNATGHSLSFALGALHFVVLGAVIWAASTGNHLNNLDKTLIIAAAGLWFGQVSNSNAHELIHRNARGPRRLGVAIYASLLFGHHASAHPRVHHVHAATDKDPNSARLGEGFYRFALRAWRGSFREGLKAENMARARAARVMPGWQHPYVFYCTGAGCALLASFAIGNASGVACLLLIALYATTQLLLSDYVQHYGLRRQVLADGKPEPIGPAHAWNAPHWYSSAMMLNAPRHSDHHLHPGATYPNLALDATKMPMLPQSLPVMAVIALVPPLWKKMMNPRVAAWHMGLKPRSAQELAPQGSALLRKGGLPKRGVTLSKHETNDDARPHMSGPNAKHTPQRRTDERGGI